MSLDERIAQLDSWLMNVDGFKLKYILLYFEEYISLTRHIQCFQKTENTKGVIYTIDETYLYYRSDSHLNYDGIFDFTIQKSYPIILKFPNHEYWARNKYEFIQAIKLHFQPKITKDIIIASKKIREQQINSALKSGELKKFIENETCFLPYPYKTMTCDDKIDLMNELYKHIKKQYKISKLPDKTIEYLNQYIESFVPEYGSTYQPNMQLILLEQTINILLKNKF